MSIIEVDEFTKLLYEVNGYRENDREYIFYYDETNNYRKVRLTDRGFNNNNILVDNYVIGGICIKKDSNISNIMKLRDNLNISKTQELKSAQLYRGKKNFEEILKNRNLYFILNWILDNAYIHYTDMDNFYYTVIDIVDSICASDIGRMLPQDLIEAMKDEVYWLLKNNLDFFVNLCNATNYPNVDKNNIEFFCSALIYLIENTLEENEEQYFVLETFRQFLKSARKNNELVFLRDYEEKTIVESFYGIRQQRCMIFQKSFHFFDNEDKDKELMEKEKMILNSKAELKNYKFIDSKEKFEIQLSDCIVSLIAKYLKFLTYNSVKYVDECVEKMNSLEKYNMNKIIQILNKSDKENPYFIETINSQKINLNRKIMNDHIEFKLKN